MKRTSSILAKVARDLNMTEAEVLEKINFLFPGNGPEKKVIHLTDNEMLKEYQVTCAGIGNIINAHGEFIEYAMDVNDKWKTYSVLVKASEFTATRMPVFHQNDYFLTRFDSHCETQMLFGDRTCDCMEQLQMAMEMIAKRGEGAVVHIKTHEGRGKGIGSKLDQLSICHALGIDTVSASLLRAELIEGINTEDFPPVTVIDTRDFLGCVAVLKFFDVPPSVRLMLQTNNPNKKKALIENGYTCDYQHVHTVPTKENIEHLRSKHEYLQHE